MRNVKLILLSLCGVLLACTLLVAALIFLMKESILARALEHVTGQRVVIGGPLSLGLSMEPSLSVSGIRIGPDEGEADPFSAHIGRLRSRIALKPLFSGVVLIRELIVDDVALVYVQKGGHEPDQAEKVNLREKVNDIDLPIFESVTLQNINVSYMDKESDYSLQVLLKTFDIGGVGGAGPLSVKGSGAVNETGFTIEGQLASFLESLRQARPYSFDLGLNIADLAFRIAGTIDDPVEGAGMNILVTADEAELSNVFAVLKVDTPRLGHLDLHATVTGDIEAPRISDFTLNISGDPAVELSAKGSVENLITGDGTDIVVSGLTSNKELIHLLLPEDLHRMNKLELSGKLLNGEGEYLIQDLSITVKEGKAGTLKAGGSIFMGQTLFNPEHSNIDLSLTMEAGDTQLLQSFLFDWLPDTGPVAGQARLAGSLMDPDLRDINVTAGEPERVWISVQGRVGSIPIDPELPVSEIDLSLSIKSDEAPQLFANLGITIPELVKVYADTQIHGSGERVIFDGITIHMTDPEGVAADVSGTTVWEKQENSEYRETIDLDVKMTAPTVASFQRLLAAKVLPDLGPVKLTCSLKGTTDLFSIENLLLQAGHPGPVQLEWRGRIGNVVPGGEIPSDVQIDSSTYVEKTSLLSPYIGLSIPDFGQLKGRSKIVGRKGGYGIDDFQAVLGNNGDNVMKAAGSVAYVMRGTEAAFEGIALSFEFRELDSRIIAEHLEKELVNIGKMNGSVSLSGNPEDLTLSEIEFLSLSQEGLKTSLQGEVQHIRFKNDMPVGGLDIILAAQAPDVSVIKKFAETELPDLGPFSMSARLKDRESELYAETFKIRTGPDADATLLIEGSMDDILNRDLINFSVLFKAATRPWLEKFYGHTVPDDHRVEGKAALTGSRDNFHIEGTAHSGKTHIDAKVEASWAKERRSIIANISAPKVYLDDLGIYPEVPETPPPAKKDSKSRRGKIFSDEPYPFPEMKEMDLSFRLDTEEVIGRGFVLNNFDIDVVLKEGLLQIGPFRTTYADGFVSLQSTLDLRGSRPEMMLDLRAEDIDTADLFSYAHSPLILGGNLNLAFDLQSSGNSPREVASSLNGDLGIAIEHGQIKQIADLLGADAIDLVAGTRNLGTYQKLNCLALDFNFDEGIGTSKVIYIDTPSVRSRGAGTVNLREETLDLVIQPKPKRGQLGGSSPVRINGPLAKPQIVKIPFRAAARLTGEILMPYVFLPIRAMGYTGSLIKNDKDEESPCLKPESGQEAQEGLSVDALANAVYTSEWTRSGTARLSDGEYREPVSPGSATEISIILTDAIAYGTLNSQPVAATVLVTDPGGSGTFFDLAIVAEEGGVPVNIAVKKLGDRVRVHSLSIEENGVTVDMTTHKPEDPMCCPTSRGIHRFILGKKGLTEAGDEKHNMAVQPLKGISWKWQQTLYNNDTKSIPSNPESYILKLLPDGRVFIHGDCNVGSGTYTLKGSHLTIEITSTTRAACPEGSLQDDFIRDLGGAAIYFFKGTDLYLDLKYDTGTMRFSR